MTAADATVVFDPKDLEAKVKAMYRKVAENPQGEFHFEMGRALAERLGYAPGDLDRIPAEAIESFAGLGHHFHLADLKPGEAVIDLGSGSGMDSFIAALKVGAAGRVIGIDMTDEQLAKAKRLQDRGAFENVTYLKGYIEEVPLPAATADVVISNGVINLAQKAPWLLPMTYHWLRERPFGSSLAILSRRPATDSPLSRMSSIHDTGTTCHPLTAPRCRMSSPNRPRTRSVTHRPPAERGGPSRSTVTQPSNSAPRSA